ncbi:MAG: lysophospholipid acyltransferase family protein [Gammaproteobacteria bacterium]|nr:lysophospholipid acyltransferase family protein [Gammaproteobacteria bacterium]
MSTNPEDGGLRNSIYRQQTRSARRLTRLRQAVYRSLVPVAHALIRFVWSWSRVVAVDGAEHLDEAARQAGTFIPVYWHQHQLFCIKTLLDRREAGVRLGFLISPSVDGEIAAMLVERLHGVAIRGSSSYTGARVLRDFHQALVRDGVSTTITPDGPRGPPWRFKPGAILLAQISGRPLVLMSYAASRAWMIQWDRFVIPKPFSRVAVAIGEPIQVPKGLDAAGLEAMQAQMEQRLGELFERARARLGGSGG